MPIKSIKGAKGQEAGAEGALRLRSVALEEHPPRADSRSAALEGVGRETHGARRKVQGVREGLRSVALEEYPRGADLRSGRSRRS